jgi:uncharacterized protein (DUF1697 family)
MATYIALLRAVNVGGTGKLPMAELKAICIELGFVNVRTYIASGNVVFESELPAVTAKAMLEVKLAAYAGKAVAVLVRTDLEMAAILANNPFPLAAPNRVVAIFLDEIPTSSAIQEVVGQNGEEIALGLREFYVHYGEGMADSKLKIPAAKAGTARNINTLSKLVEIASVGCAN